MRMKHIYSLIFSLAFASISFAQDYQWHVSTDQQPGATLIEEFTGIHCGYCPQAHKISADLIKAQPDKVNVIAVHAGGFSTPNHDEPDFRTDLGEELNNHFEITGYPSGVVNRAEYNGSVILDRSWWVYACRDYDKSNAAINLYATAKYDNASRELTVEVEGYRHDDATDAKLAVALLQNNIIGPQSGGGLGREYIHHHMLRDYLTDSYGDTVEFDG